MEEPTDRPLGPAIERRLEEILARVAADLGIPRDDIDPMAERFVLGFTHRGHVSAAELVALRDEGARAARAGVPISRKVDVVLTTSWVMLEAAAAAGREGLGADADELLDLAVRLMRGADLAASALAEGFASAERALAARLAAVRRGVLDELLAIPRLDPDGVNRAIRRAASIGLDPDGRYRVIVARTTAEIEDEGPLPSAVERILDRAPARQPRLVAVYAGDLVILLADPWRTRDTVPAIEAELSAHGRWHGLEAGPTALDRLHELVPELLDGLRVSQAIHEDGVLRPMAAIALERALLRDPVVLAEAVRWWLEPLAKAPRSGDALVATLDAWVRNGRSVTATARAMGVGIRTVSHRLDRAAELLGQPSLDGDVAVRLTVALLGQELLRAVERDRVRPGAADQAG
jgi:hypothetical protein